MQKLNELAHMAKLNADNFNPEMTIRVKDILAIAEAFLVLERRVEAAEAKANNLNDGWLNAIEERDEARAKLAEMKNQEITGWRAVQNDKRDLREPLYLDGFSEPTGWKSDYSPVYSIAAPAVNLSELVPESDESRLSFENFMIENYDTRLKRSGIGYAGQVVNQMWQSWSACRAAILCKIKEMKNAN